MRGRVSLVLLLTAAVLPGATLEDTLAKARKALANEGVETAWKLAQQALSDAPESAAARELAGEVQFRRGEILDAEREFRSALKLDPKYALAWWGLARVAQCTSRYKTANEDVRRAYELDPRDPRIAREWAMHLEGPAHIEALEKLASAFDPNRSGAELEELRQHIQLDRTLGSRKLMVLESAYEKTELPLLTLVSATHIRSFGLEVNFNGTPLRLILDTGASGFMLPRRLAEKAGITSLTGATFHGFGNNRQLGGGYRGLAERVRIGGVEFRDALVDVSNQESVGTADGLVGANVFAAFLVTLDFPARKIRLSLLPGAHPGTDGPADRADTPELRASLPNAIPVFRFGHLLLVPARVGDSHPLLFVLDTGSERTLVSYTVAAGAGSVNRDDRAGFRGLSGKVADVYQTGSLSLEFAGYRQKNPGMTAFDMWDQSRRLGTEVSGFLGLPVLDLFVLTVDYRDGLVSFDRPQQ